MHPEPHPATRGDRGTGFSRDRQPFDLVAAHDDEPVIVPEQPRPRGRTGRFVRNPRTGLAAADSWSPATPTTPTGRDPSARHDTSSEGAEPREPIEPTLAQSFQQLLDLNPDGTVIVDTRGIVLLHNARAAELLAIHPDDLLGGRFRHRWDAPGTTTVEVRDENGRWSALEIRSRPFAIGDRPGHAVTLRPERGGDHALPDDPDHAFHDELTGLPGREAFLNRVHETMRAERDRDHPIAVARIDLDQFRRIDDFYGHAIGDRVLCGVANRLATAVRPGDYPGRLGSDDFVVLLAPSELDEQVAVAHRVLEALQQPFEVDGNSIMCNPSVGLARHRPDEDEQDLLTSAEVALVGDRMQGAGSGTVAIGESRMDKAGRHLATVNRSMTRALAEDQLFLLYQPVFNLRTGHLVSLEALVRWEHPDDGLIEPGEFIRMADQTGVIISLGEWVLSEVVDQILEWRERRPDAEVPPVSINLTGRQLIYPGFRRHALMTLARRGLDPSAIRFEITETALIDRRGRIEQILDELGGDGFELDLDDFGTGLSSITHLREFPISAIKVDGSFVRRIIEDERSRQLVEAAIQAAHTFEIAVVAEGVETVEQKDLLTRWGCDLVQGYLLARPLNPVEASRFFGANDAGREPLLRSQGLLRRQS